MGNGHQSINEDLLFCGWIFMVELVEWMTNDDHITEVFPPCRLLMSVEGAWLQDALFCVNQLVLVDRK
jgi:hypothetical protein